MLKFFVILIMGLLSALWNAAIGMWITGELFPQLSYWNYFQIAIVFTAWVSSAISMNAVSRDLD